MNADDLVRQFEKVADAPNAIARLRRFIVDLAVRGKLVSQNAGDAPASRLLEEIDAMRAGLAASAKASIDRSQVDLSDAPFELPRSWVWTRLGRLTSYIQRGKSPKYADSEGSPVVSQKCVQWSGLDLSAARMVTTESLAEYDEVRFLRDGDLLWNSTGTGTIGRVIRLIQPPIRLVCDSHVTVVRCLGVVPEYLRTWLRSDHVYGSIEGRAAGSTNQVELTAQMAISQLVPLPPLAEQHRIVAKVDELMALCDRLEAARAEREAARDRLTAASLARLNTPDPKTFSDDARFALDVLAALVARADQVGALRQTILNFAVRGLLVPQHTEDDSATTLADKIATAKSALASNGGLKKDKDLMPSPNEPPYLVPHTWVWLRLQDAFEISRGGSPRPAGDPRYFGGPIPWITVREITKDIHKYLEQTETGLTQEGAARSRFINPGDLLLTNSGATLGVPKISKIRACMNDGVAVLRLFHDVPLNDFAYLYLQSQTDAFRRVNQGMGQPNLNTSIIAGWSFPLPPLNEQRRIVQRVDELMSICDQLEASLNTAAGHRSRLLEALLLEALDSGDRASASAPADEAAAA
jgi:type I restriction enzyme, S subunit